MTAIAPLSLEVIEKATHLTAASVNKERLRMRLRVKTSAIRKLKGCLRKTLRAEHGRIGTTPVNLPEA
jgi:hypothetical protein